ncbi:MAG: 4Fe-4S dicluster domain-containing protein [Staphylococcus equorum]|nr:4Fe-4S dicluster domain-containing protein [Staphylococcus equorum]
MIILKENKDCCGCNACVQRCPKNCITMQEDNEGFLYPVIDVAFCVDCGLCESVCPVINQSSPRKPRVTYAAKNRDKAIRGQSSSGGVFTALAKQVIYDNGVVFGAKFNAKREVVHAYTETVEGLADFRGSKYVQSIVGHTYKEAERFLKKGRRVLFSGTPCQISGLNLFLRKKYNNLLTVDFVCHGVPSPTVWQRYLEEVIPVEKQSSITEISFRDKINGWKSYNFIIKEKDEIILREKFHDNLFMKGFLADLYLRPSCYACPVKSLKSNSDITLGDYWGIQNILPTFDDDYGVSLVFLHDDTWIDCFTKMNLDLSETSFEDAIKYNPAVVKSVNLPDKRKDFWDKYKYSHEGLGLIIKKNTRLSLKQKIKRNLYPYYKKIMEKKWQRK